MAFPTAASPGHSAPLSFLCGRKAEPWGGANFHLLHSVLILTSHWHFKEAPQMFWVSVWYFLCRDAQFAQLLGVGFSRLQASSPCTVLPSSQPPGLLVTESQSLTLIRAEGQAWLPPKGLSRQPLDAGSTYPALIQFGSHVQPLLVPGEAPQTKQEAPSAQQAGHTRGDGRNNGTADA